MGKYCTHYTAADKPCSVCEKAGIDSFNAASLDAAIAPRREQRRYEIARDVMAACAGYPVTERVDPITTIDALATAAVQCADALLAALEAK